MMFIKIYRSRRLCGVLICRNTNKMYNIKHTYNLKLKQINKNY